MTDETQTVTKNLIEVEVKNQIKGLLSNILDKWANNETMIEQFGQPPSLEEVNDYVSNKKEEILGEAPTATKKLMEVPNLEQLQAFIFEQLDKIAENPDVAEFLKSFIDVPVCPSAQLFLKHMN